VNIMAGPSVLLRLRFSKVKDGCSCLPKLENKTKQSIDTCDWGGFLSVKKIPKFSNNLKGETELLLIRWKSYFLQLSNMTVTIVSW